MYFFQNIKIGFLFAKALLKFCRDEFKRGTLKKNLGSLIKSREINEDMSWAELLEEKARRYTDRPYLTYEGRTYTYRQMDENANRMANFVATLGGARGKGIAMMMGNSPQFLDVFFGIQKIGMYAVPMNTSLRGDSLLYILNHSDAEILVIDQEFLDEYKKIASSIEHIKTVIVNFSEGSENGDILTIPLSDAYKHSPIRPEGDYVKEDICFILYTSGTTGLPKGVVYRYDKSTVKLLSLAAYAFYKKSDVMYTCLPLFHGNALFLTITTAMHLGAKVVLGKKFSASRFWDEIRENDVTTFNTIGAIIPIIMKQPEKANDIDNKVRFTLSAACPAEDWPKFEKRFGIKIYEGYGSVDGGGKSIMNLGNAPIGSIGRPNPNTAYRLVDDDMLDVPDGTPGQLIFESKGPRKSVEYFKNEKAGNDKLKGGWIHTGDLVRRDKKGYLYFVGRNAEFMRIKGENVSAYMVEHSIQKHPSVLEAAVYAVPSALAEDEIMASISLVDGHELKEADLLKALGENLPHFAVPRYVKIVNEFPKTETQRIIKKELEKLGVIPGTYDSQKDMHINISE